MLDAYNCSFVLQTTVPDRIQYSCIRANFNQDVRVNQWHMGFFELCEDGTEHGTCSLAQYCQCAFYAELFSGFIDEDLSPEEERARVGNCGTVPGGSPGLVLSDGTAVDRAAWFGKEFSNV